MSISPTQLVQPLAGAEGASEPQRSASAPISTASTGASKADPPTTPRPSAPPPVKFSTDLQIDNHHQVYYVVVDDSSGDVLLEIPSAALRQIGENLSLPLIGDAQVPSVDVKS